MRSVRALLTRGNSKVGEAIHLWSLPPLSTCPGSTRTCERWCYARTHRFRYPAVKRRLRWNLAQAKKPDFADRMAAEIRARGCVVVRVHAAGDFFSAGYAEGWLRVMQQCPEPRYYWYSRSWQVPDIRPVLERMAARPNCRGWFSTDADTGTPEDVPLTVRIAHLQTRADEPVPDAHLVFRPRGRRRHLLPLPVVCPSERPDGRGDVTCGLCQRCWQ